MLADGASSGEPAIQVRDGATGAFVKNVFFLDGAWRASQSKRGGG